MDKWKMLLILILTGFMHQTLAIPIDNAVIGDPEIQCDSDAITVSFNVQSSFEGNVYVKGMFDQDECRITGDGDNGARIKLPFDSCNLQRSRSLNPRGIFVTAAVIISFHPQFVTKVDRAYRIQCFYMEADKTVSADLDVSEITTLFHFLTVPMPVCRYEILDGGPNGEPIQSAVVGQQVYHKWTCDSETVDTFCAIVHTCYVDDGNGNRIKILDSDGCAIDKYLLNNLEYPTDLMAGQEAHVYKYADKAQLYYHCQISITVKEPNEFCSRPECPEPKGFGSINSDEVDNISNNDQFVRNDISNKGEHDSKKEVRDEYEKDVQLSFHRKSESASKNELDGNSSKGLVRNRTEPYNTMEKVSQKEPQQTFQIGPLKVPKILQKEGKREEQTSNRGLQNILIGAENNSFEGSQIENSRILEASEDNSQQSKSPVSFQRISENARKVAENSQITLSKSPLSVNEASRNNLRKNEIESYRAIKVPSEEVSQRGPQRGSQIVFQKNLQRVGEKVQEHVEKLQKTSYQGYPKIFNEPFKSGLVSDKIGSRRTFQKTFDEDSKEEVQRQLQKVSVRVQEDTQGSQQTFKGNSQKMLIKTSKIDLGKKLSETHKTLKKESKEKIKSQRNLKKMIEEVQNERETSKRTYYKGSLSESGKTSQVSFHTPLESYIEQTPEATYAPFFQTPDLSILSTDTDTFATGYNRWRRSLSSNIIDVSASLEAMDAFQNRDSSMKALRDIRFVDTSQAVCISVLHIYFLIVVIVLLAIITLITIHTLLN